MPVQGIQITMTTDAAAVALAGNGTHGVLRVILRNRGTGTAYLGSSGVGSTAGYAFSSADTPLSLTLYQTEVLYGASSGTAPVLDVLRFNETT